MKFSDKAFLEEDSIVKTKPSQQLKVDSNLRNKTN